MKHYSCLKMLMTKLGFPEPNHPLFALVNLKVYKPDHHQGFTSNFYGLTYIKPALKLTDKNNEPMPKADLKIFHPGQVMNLGPFDFVMDGYVLFFDKNLFGDPFFKKKAIMNDAAGYFNGDGKNQTPVDAQHVLDFFHLIEYECYPFDDELSLGLITNHIQSLLIYSSRINRWTSGRYISAF